MMVENVMTDVVLSSPSLCLFLFLTLFLLLANGFVIARVDLRQDMNPINLSVRPTESVVVIYTTFRVNVSVVDVGYEGLFGYQFRLNYDSSVLKGVDVLFPEDHFLKPTNPENLYIPERWINGTGGYAEVAVTLLGAESGKVGNGTLSNVVFWAEEVGTSNLTFSNYFLAGPSSQIYNVVASSGFVEVVLPDFNNDGKVDISDLSAVCRAFDSCPGDARWNPACDVNKDFIINIMDVAVTAKAYGKTVIG
jgi:hypothetical protein